MKMVRCFRGIAGFPRNSPKTWNMVAMNRVKIGLVILVMMLVLALRVHAQGQDDAEVEVASPEAGEALRGLVTLMGSTVIEGALSWELTFSYASDTTGTWFLIFESAEPVQDGPLARWDTTTISDGNYNLRLTVYLEGGRRAHFVVPGLRVRNYTPIETNTPTPTITSTPFTETPRPSLTPTITQSPTGTPVPNTPTPLPTNPLELPPGAINYSLLRGAVGALGVFAVMGVYATLRKIARMR